MATFTIVFTDGEKDGHVEVDVTSDPKIGPDDEPTVAQAMGINLCQIMSQINVAMGVDQEFVNGDGRPTVKSPVSF